MGTGAQKKTILAIVAAVLLVGSFVGLFYKEMTEGANGYPDVFSHGLIINTGETVGNVLSVDGNVYLAGTVSKKVVILNGDLTISQTGRIEGCVLILNGRITCEAGAHTQGAMHFAYGNGSDIIKTIVISVLIFFVLGVPFTIMAVILAIRQLLVRPLFHRLRETMVSFEEKKTSLYLVFGFTACSALLLLFFYLAQETLWSHEMDLLDSVIIWLVQYYASPFWDKIMLTFTAVGSAYCFGLIGMLLLGLLLYCRRWHEGAVLSVCLGGSILLNLLLKNIFARPRPDVLPIVSAVGYSFPSGHAMVALCFYGMSAYLLSRIFTHILSRIMIFLLFGILVMLIGISRIYLGVHYPSDVLAGYIAGATWLAFCISLLAWRERK